MSVATKNYQKIFRLTLKLSLDYNIYFVKNFFMYLVLFLMPCTAVYFR